MVKLLCWKRQEETESRTHSRNIVIGLPTDFRHVAHYGDGGSMEPSPDIKTQQLANYNIAGLSHMIDLREQNGRTFWDDHKGASSAQQLTAH